MPIDPVTASINSVGRIAAASISAYRPSGVPRTGSREDRAIAYRRFSDAAVSLGMLTNGVASLHFEAGRGADKYLEPLFPRLTELGSELVCALYGLRLCAPPQVLDTAENVGKKVPSMSLPKEELAEAMDAYVQAQIAFVAAAREDLAYNPKKWQLLRKRKERAYLKNRRDTELTRP